jgi:hypothetical protein
MFGVTALAAAFGLLGLVGPAEQSRAEEKKAEAAEKLSPAAQAAQDIGTANDLIDYARRIETAMPLLVGAQMLATIADPSGEKIEVEGAGKGAAPTRKEFLEGLLAEAKGMKDGKSEAAMKLAEVVRQSISEKPRDTPSGGTSWTGIVEEYNNNPKHIVTLKRFFIGGKTAKITVTRLVNTSIPLSVKVTGPKGQVIPPATTNTLNYSWVVPKKDEGNYVIEIKNNHNKDVGVKVVTN